MPSRIISEGEEEEVEEEREKNADEEPEDSFITPSIKKEREKNAEEKKKEKGGGDDDDDDDDERKEKEAIEDNTENSSRPASMVIEETPEMDLSEREVKEESSVDVVRRPLFPVPASSPRKPTTTPTTPTTSATIKKETLPSKEGESQSEKRAPLKLGGKKLIQAKPWPPKHRGNTITSPPKKSEPGGGGGGAYEGKTPPPTTNKPIHPFFLQHQQAVKVCPDGFVDATSSLEQFQSFREDLRSSETTCWGITYRYDSTNFRKSDILVGYLFAPPPSPLARTPRFTPPSPTLLFTTGEEE